MVQSLKQQISTGKNQLKEYKAKLVKAQRQVKQFVKIIKEIKKDLKYDQDKLKKSN